MSTAGEGACGFRTWTQTCCLQLPVVLQLQLQLQLVPCVCRRPSRPPAPRSQPPLLSAMVRAVYETTHNRQLLADALPLLVREAEYWTTGPKAVAVRGRDRRVYALSR